MLKNLSRKKVLYVAISSVFLTVSVMFFEITKLNVEGVRSDMVLIDKALSQSRRNKNDIEAYIAYKKSFGGVVESIRVEPVNISANFDLNNAVYRINGIIDSTYKNRGFFFLDNFHLGKNKNSENEDKEERNSKKELRVVSVSGKKAILFLR